MNRALKSLVGIATGWWLSTGCTSSATTDTLPLTVLFEHNQCGMQHSQTTVIGNRQQLQQLIELTAGRVKDGDNKHQLLATVLTKKEYAPVLPEVLKSLAQSYDFNENTLLFIARGTQPNPGYGIHIHNQKALLSSGDLQLPLTLGAPDKQHTYAQVTVSPCVLLSVKTAKTIDNITFNE